MMKSNFLNLPSSASGDARRHVPFKSIIHKPLSIIFALFFFMLHCFLVPSSAAMVQPEFNPIVGASAAQVQNFVASLTPDQLQVFYLLSGTQAISYTGFGNYELTEQFDNSNSVSNWIRTVGEKFYGDLFLASIGMPSDIAKPLLESLQGTAQYASTINTTYDQWLNNLNSSEDPFLIPIGVGVIPAFNQFFAINDGVYNWQMSTSDFYDQGFIYNTVNMSSSLQSEYDIKLSNLSIPRTLWNLKPGEAVSRFSPSNIMSESIQFNFFFDTSVHKLYLVDNNGVLVSFNGLPFVFVNHDAEYSYSTTFIQYLNLNGVSYNLNLSYNELVTMYLKALCEEYFGYLRYRDIPPNGSYKQFYVSPNINQMFMNAYYGTSWSDRVLIEKPTTGLNFDQNTQSYVLNPVEDILLDIKGLIQELIQTNELKQPVLDNLYDTSGEPDPDPSTQQISVTVLQPDSGINVPNNLFAPLTKEGGYISYLWYMTKPLVQYTSDLVQTLVFPDDTGEGFDITGPGAIVFGVISLGLIGGLVVKCLL